MEGGRVRREDIGSSHECIKFNKNYLYYLINMKTKTKTKTKAKRIRIRKNKGTRKNKGGGLFDWFNKKNNSQNITESNDSIIYLDSIKNSTVWGSVYMPPYHSPDEICDRIDEISKALQNNGILTKCKFNNKIQNRINNIINYSNSYKNNPNKNFNTLTNYFIEIQLYILVCRTQFTNRGIGLDLLGTVIFR